MKSNISENQLPVILGITAFNHDSSACIISEGQLVAFAEEERFNGQKHTGDFPYGAIDYCLSEARKTSSEITDVAFYFNLKKCWFAYFKNNNPFNFLLKPSIFFRFRFYHEFVWLLSFTSKVKSIKRLLSNKHVKIHYINHHDAHVWYGYYSSGSKDCIVLSNDSIGEDVSTLGLKFIKNKTSINTEILIKQNDPNSLGYIYGAVTDFLGFKRGEGEGRVMALASFGDECYYKFFLTGIKYLPRGIFRTNNNLIIHRNFQSRGQRLSCQFYKKIGLSRSRTDKIEQRHCNIAAGIQHILEKTVIHQLDFLTKLSSRIVLVGGVAQNSVVNGIMSNRYPEVEFIIPPIPHDAGCSIGAAIILFYKKNGYLPNFVDTSQLGPQFSDHYIIDMLNNYKINFKILNNDNISDLIKNLSCGKTVAIFRGRMESGPRALGNRSIIADPRSSLMKDHLNANVKFRESFRPYGGLILAEDVDKLLIHKNIYKQGPYMNFVYSVKEEWLDKIPSLVHVDKTCRIQIVEQKDKFLCKLLNDFNKVTGVPILINTSLNVRGTPLARTPEDAVKTFYTSALDCLLFNEKILVEKR